MMNQIIKLSVCIAFVLVSAIPATAGDNLDKLASRLVKQQKEAQKQVVNMWLNGEKGKQLTELVSQMVKRHVRLRTMKEEFARNSVLAEANLSAAETPKEVARLIVIQHFERKGLNLTSKKFVEGEYMIRKGTLSENVQYQKTEKDEHQ